jgi:hypothetical protein
VNAWAWDDAIPTPTFDAALASSPASVNQATFIVELSSPIKESRLLPGLSLTSLPRIMISPTGQMPHPELIGTRTAVEEFARAWRRALALIENDLPDVRTLHTDVVCLRRAGDANLRAPDGSR